MRYRKGACDLKRKKAVIAAAFISGISLLLSEAAALPAYATEEIHEPAETEKDGGESGTRADAGGESSVGQSTEDSSAESGVEDTEGEQEGAGSAKEDDKSGAVGEDSGSGGDMTEEAGGSGGAEEGNGAPDGGAQEENGEIEDTETESPEGGEDTGGEDAEASAVPAQEAAASVPVRLQVPQKFEIMLNPWEMDGQEQIFSAEYTIKNVSGERGTLKLTGIAVGSEEDIVVQSDSDDIHDGNDQNIWIAMVINGEDTIALSPDGTDYETVLEADAGVTLTFTGAMNENAVKGWRDSDVEVSVVYDWVTDAEKAAVGEAVPQEEENEPQQEDAAEGSAEDGKIPEDGVAVGKPDSGLRGEETAGGETSVAGAAETGGAAQEKTPDTDMAETDGTEEEKPSDGGAVETGGAEEEKPSESGAEEISTEKEDESEK